MSSLHQSLTLALKRSLLTPVFAPPPPGWHKGAASERYLKWGGGWWVVGESLRNLSKNILKTGWVKAKVARRGGGLEGVTTPPPQKKNLIAHEDAIELLDPHYCMAKVDFPPVTCGKGLQ